jgi:hypothetical protein|tara:strand:- start:409 stop:2910 length:2502 start_codon:yes stop_codon:yes gene_type:complete
LADQSKNNIDKALEALNLGLDIEPGDGVEIEMEKEVEFDPAFEIQEDGSAIIPDNLSEQVATEHTSNLADFLDEKDLGNLSSDLVNLFESDKDSRKDWEDTYVKGLDMLGFKYENRTQPFEGASGVVHPLLAESVTQFQAQAYKELLPASGPVNCQIIGEVTPEIEDQSQRVKEFMNYELMNVMREYDPDMDQLLFYLPLAGSAFKKVYYDGQLERAVAKFVSGEDLVVDYFATDIETAQRITHCIKMSGNDLRKNQVNGFYSDVSVTSGEVDPSEIREKINELEGNSPPYSTDSEEHLLLEMHVDLDLPGFEDPSGIKLPYIVTIDKYSQTVLSIKRNWDETDKKRNKKQYFVHFKFLPGLGFYGFGLIHMLGGLSRTATSVLRQLIDAGTLANLPAGFKARGMRIRDNDEPIQPGEFRDVDVSGASIRESLLPLPFKEPSATLFQLLGFAVDAGKSFSAIADMKMGEGNEQNPVGTTLAILERGTKVMSAIHKRMHYAQKIEFNLLADVFQSYLPPEYPYMVKGGDRMIKQSDFDDRVDIIPISDPNIFSMSQRIMLAQQQLQLAQANPQLHNVREAYRRMYMAMGVDNVDGILKPDPEIPQPMSPAMENATAMRGQQPKAFPKQNHPEHMKAHADFIATRMVQINPQLYAMMESHLMEHIALLAAEQVEQQPEIAQQNQQIQQMMQQAEQNKQMAPQAQQAQQQFMQEKESQIATIEAKMVKEMVEEERKRAEEMQDDPLVKLKQQEIDLRALETMLKTKEEKARLNKDWTIDSERIDLDRDKLEAQVGIDILKTKTAEADLKSKEKLAALKENMTTIRDSMKGNSNGKS